MSKTETAGSRPQIACPGLQGYCLAGGEFLPHALRPRLHMSFRLAGILAGILMAGPALADRCKTSAEGQYACTYTKIDERGSFVIEGKGKPKYMLNRAHRENTGFVSMEADGKRTHCRESIFGRAALGRVGSMIRRV